MKFLVGFVIGIIFLAMFIHFFNKFEPNFTSKDHGNGGPRTDGMIILLYVVSASDGIFITYCAYSFLKFLYVLATIHH